MCGIGGAYDPVGGRVSLEELQRMLTALGHRGPDESGVYIDDHVGLAHSRLSIIDLQSGLQPVHNEDETVWVILNGEVYNYPELREDLLRNGHRFSTSSDTEVLVHLYEEKGPDLVKALDGQFAFALWDSRRGRLFLARDHLGICPLHYCQVGDLLLFASEVKALLPCNGVQRELSPQGIDQIFTFWTTLPGETVFQGIRELPPGHTLVASPKGVAVERYWQVPLCERDRYLELPAEQAAQNVRELLREAVRIRLRADVPVGCYLSGGLDSSIVTALVARHFNHEVQTFGIRFEDEVYDEGKFQQDVVDWLGVQHRTVRVTNEQIGASLPETVWHCEKPLLRTAPVPLFLLSRAVREDGFKVVLTGEGADECFGGYNIFKEAKIRRFWSRQPQSPWRPKLLEQLYPYVFRDARSKTFLSSFFGRHLEQADGPFFSHLLRWENTSRMKGFFSRQLRAAIGSYSSCQQLGGLLPSAFSRLDGLAKAQYLEMVLFLSGYLLSSQADRVAMAHAVETRIPYLDPAIVEFMMQAPPRWKLLGLREKHVLRQAFRDLLPRSVSQRPKHPYRAPIVRSILNDASRDYVQELLGQRALEMAGLFDPARVRMLLAKVESSPDPGEMDSMALVGILSTQLVHHQFIETFDSRIGAATAPTLIVDRRSHGCPRAKGAAVGVGKPIPSGSVPGL
ncbi:MAG: asparagine synthase (glutamine-hydrolyzing) [Sedimentisphaerales bacterium]|nr:asparagine synthase (glutamine-hydrolyzing) [Sedimentisphaerales bacterium]